MLLKISFEEGRGGIENGFSHFRLGLPPPTTNTPSCSPQRWPPPTKTSEEAPNRGYTVVSQEVVDSIRGRRTRTDRRGPLLLPLFSLPIG